LYLDDIKTISQPYWWNNGPRRGRFAEFAQSYSWRLQDDFNLFVIEGYGHKEIAVMLNISKAHQNHNWMLRKPS
jgi:RNA polymerase sigma-70 factor (ECF subfamily)